MSDGRTLTRGRFTAEQRAELRAAIDQSRREAIAEMARLRETARVRDVNPSQVLRAARKAQRAQQAKALAPALVAPDPKPVAAYCVFCGTRAPGGVCRAHTDLLDLDEYTTAGGRPSLDGSSARKEAC